MQKQETANQLKEERKDGWIAHIQLHSYSAAGLPWGPVGEIKRR